MSSTALLIDGGADAVEQGVVFAEERDRLLVGRALLGRQHFGDGANGVAGCYVTLRRTPRLGRGRRESGGPAGPVGAAAEVLQVVIGVEGEIVLAQAADAEAHDEVQDGAHHREGDQDAEGIEAKAGQKPAHRQGEAKQGGQEG